jgi:transketolase C-terminal domain/subunit
MLVIKVIIHVEQKKKVIICCNHYLYTGIGSSAAQISAASSAAPLSAIGLHQW